MPQVFPKGLWVVATPIGNLLDMAPRAIQALEEADLILCEDTRRTQELLMGLSISSKKLERLDAHASQDKIDYYVGQMQSGKRVALVTDAGTPALSDPGARMVQVASLAGVVVTPFPGPSAITALLSVAGLDETEFTFRGFFPRENKDQEHELKVLLSPYSTLVFVWYESPQRIDATLRFLQKNLSAVHGVVGKELTKIHEKIFRGNLQELSEKVSSEISKEGALGEWCFALQVPKDLKSQDSLDWIKVLTCMLDAGVSVSDAAKKVSQHFGASKNDAYEAALRLTQKKKN